MAAAKESIPATGPSIPNIRKFKGKFSIAENKSELKLCENSRSQILNYPKKFRFCKKIQ